MPCFGEKENFVPFSEFSFLKSPLSFRNAGQCCSAGSRTYVADELFDEFVQLSVNLAKGKVLGDPSHANTTMGTLINKQQQTDVAGFVARAKAASGVKIAFQGPTPAKGYFASCVVVTAPHDSEVVYF